MRTELLALVLVAALLQACGLKGDLYLPAGEPAPEESAPAAPETSPEEQEPEEAD